MEEEFLDFSLLGFVDILLVVGDDSLGEGLPDGVDLGDVAAAAHANADVEVLEPLEAQQQDGLQHFGAQGLRLKQLDGRPVHSQHAPARAHRCHRHRVFLAAEALGQVVLALGHMAGK